MIDKTAEDHTLCLGGLAEPSQTKLATSVDSARTRYQAPGVLDFEPLTMTECGGLRHVPTGRSPVPANTAACHIRSKRSQ